MGCKSYSKSWQTMYVTMIYVVLANTNPLLANSVNPCYTPVMQVLTDTSTIEINGHTIKKEKGLWQVTRVGDSTPIIFFNSPVEAMTYAENAGFEFLEQTFFGKKEG